jgi:hypothetical protein
MKHIYKLFISIYLILIIFILTSFSSIKTDPFTEIFKACGSIPVSCGIKLVINEKGMDMVSFLKSFGIESDAGFSIDYSGDYISFKSKSSDGYMEYLPEEEAYILFFESENTKDNPEALKSRVLSSASRFSDYKYYLFQKGRVNESDFKSAVLDEIKVLNGKNVSYQDIENGWNAVFKIENSPYKGFIVDNGRLINYQCTLMKYKSGNYLIVGTPMIAVTY